MKRKTSEGARTNGVTQQIVPVSGIDRIKENDEPQVSSNVEMYLKTLVRLYDGDGPVSTTAIAKELSVMPPSASTMLKRLDAEGFVTHEGRHGVIPTHVGARIGALTLRRQLLAERLLVEHLGVSWEIAASEACRLEHSISPLVERGLSNFLGAPTTCPHGHPVPREDGTLWRHEHTVALSELTIGIAANVVAVPHDMPELLAFLADADLRPGAAVSVHQRDQIVGLLTIVVDGVKRVISLQLASTIFMQQLESLSG
ncbi:MAG: metal-dependent transcriptional regulator [Candidatus Velthaea sp.]